MNAPLKVCYILMENVRLYNFKSQFEGNNNFWRKSFDKKLNKQFILSKNRLILSQNTTIFILKIDKQQYFKILLKTSDKN